MALAGAAVFFLGIDHQSVCQQQIAGESGRLVDVCGPPDMLDLAPFALLIAIFLWPDLGELAVTGLFTLRRRVDRQETHQEQLESQIQQVNQQLTQLATLAQSQSQSAATAVGEYHYHDYAADQEDVKRGIVKKQEAAEQQPGEERESAQQQREPQAVERAEAELLEVTAERQRLLGEFVREYSRLEPYILPTGSPLVVELGELDPDRRKAVEDFRAIFDDEIRALRQTRNAAVHQPELVSVETLRGAILNTRELSRILFERIG